MIRPLVFLVFFLGILAAYYVAKLPRVIKGILDVRNYNEHLHEIVAEASDNYYMPDEKGLALWQKEEIELKELCDNLYSKCVKHMKDQKVTDTLSEIFNCIRHANKYIDITEPWKLAKDESKKDKLDTVLYYLSETIRIATTLLQAYLIEIPAKIFNKFGLSGNLQTFDSIKEFSLKNFGQMVDKGENLFPRLDTAKEIEFLDTPNETKRQAPPHKRG